VPRRCGSGGFPGPDVARSAERHTNGTKAAPGPDSLNSTIQRREAAVSKRGGCIVPRKRKVPRKVPKASDAALDEIALVLIYAAKRPEVRAAVEAHTPTPHEAGAR
jgi:hypothetical protein